MEQVKAGCQSDHPPHQTAPGEVAWTLCQGRINELMAARNRPRSGLVNQDAVDAHEERNMWNQIVADVKRLKAISARSAEISITIRDTEANMNEGI